jgi:hypothetical protein
VLRDELAACLLLALELRDDLALASVLSPDVRMLVDTGDLTGGELRGRASVGRALRAEVAKHPDVSLQAVQVNGAPGITVHRHDGEVVGVLGIDVAPGSHTIQRLWLSAAPGKLAHWNRRRPSA